MEVIATVKYRKIRPIGSAIDGQNSDVFLAFDEHLQTELVIKEIEKKRLADPANYFLEARALHASAHPRVVPVRWAGLSGEHVCIAMPLMAGGSLAARIAQKPLRATEVIRIGQDLCEGVAQVHLKRLVHLDIKPTNVLFDADDRGALTDFGLAIPLDVYGTGDARDQALFPSFFPPELKASRGVATNASDVYQIGLTLYSAINGEPYVSEQWNRVREPWPSGKEAIVEGRFPDRSFLPGVPLGLRQVIVRALDLDPAKRQVGARALAEELGSVSVKEDWVVEEYAPDHVRWRLRTAGHADLVILRTGALPAAAVEIWTEGEKGRRRRSPGAWSTGLRTQAQLTKALNKAFRAAAQ